MSQWDELIRILDERQSSRINPTLRWATVDSVNWEKRLANVTVTVDELTLFDVELGLGDFDRRPKVGSKCLVLLTEHSKTGGYLLAAAELEGLQIMSQNESLKDVLNDLIDEVNKILVVHGTTINIAAMTAIKQRLNKILI